MQNELKRARGIPTSLSCLDVSLGAKGTANSGTGIRRGIVTDIFGPPGVGKTTLGIQLAINALNASGPGSRVVWINTGSSLVQRRLHDVAAAYDAGDASQLPSSPPIAGNVNESPLDRLIYLQPQTLAHLLTLVLHPTSSFPPPATSLLIIDDLSNYITSHVPRSSRPHQASTPSNIIADKQASRASSRRFNILSSLSSGLTRLASSRHIAVVLLSNVTVSIKNGERALLRSALSGQMWDPAIDTRIVLYRDFPPEQLNDRLNAQERKGWRVADVLRAGGKDVLRPGVGFVIEDGGLRQLSTSRESDTLVPVKEVETQDSHIDQASINQPAVSTISRQIQPSSQAPHTVTLPIHSSPPLDAVLSTAADQVHINALSPTTSGDVDVPRASKRKADEIADSESEGDDAVNPYEVRSTTPKNGIGLDSYQKEQGWAGWAGLRLTGTEDMMRRESEDEDEEHEENGAGEDLMEDEEMLV